MSPAGRIRPRKSGTVERSRTLIQVKNLAKSSFPMAFLPLFAKPFPMSMLRLDIVPALQIWYSVPSIPVGAPPVNMQEFRGAGD